MEKLELVLPTYQGMVSPVPTRITSLVCMDALVGISAVLVSETFQEVVVISLETKVCIGVAVSSLTPGAVTLT